MIGIDNHARAISHSNAIAWLIKEDWRNIFHALRLTMFIKYFIANL